MSQFFSKFVPLLQKYFLVLDKQGFKTSYIQNSEDFLFLKLIQSEDEQEIETLSERLEFPYDITKLFVMKTIFKKIQLSDNDQLKKKLFQTLKQKWIQIGFDYYQKPQGYNSDQVQNIKQNLPHQVDQSELSLYKYLSQNQKKTNIYSKITSYGFLFFTPEMIMNSNKLDLFENYINKIRLGSLENIYQILTVYYNISKQKNQNFNFAASIYQQLTQQQLEGLAIHLPSVLRQKLYFINLFKKKWYIKLSNFKENKYESQQRLKQKQNILQKFHQNVKKLNNNLLKDLEGEIMYEILSIDLILLTPNSELFLNYLQRPRQIISLFDKQFTQALKTTFKNIPLDLSWDIYFSPKYINFHQFVQKYLRLLFSQDNFLLFPNLIKFIDQKYLNILLYKYKLQKADINLQIINTVLNQSQIQRLKSQKLILITQNNKKHFKINQDIILSLRVKNIHRITAQVYQISTQKHYLNSSQPIPDDTPVHLIHPLKQITKSINYTNSFQIKDIEFDFKDILQKKRAIYIIEFKGQGISSRAVIKKGSLICVQSQKLNGLQLRFCDQQGNSLQNLSLRIRDRKVLMKEKYIIPYGTNVEKLNVIAIKDDFAELIKLSIRKQTYDLKIGCIYNQQNFKIGTKAKILLRARLYSYDQLVTLKFLKENKITVTVVNYKDISSSFDINNVNWNNKDEFQLEVPIQTYLKSINIKVYSKTQNLYDGKPQQFNIQNHIKFNQITENTVQTTCAQIFLSRDNSGYKIQLLGKNGEPKPNLVVKLIFKSLLFTQNIEKKYQTNQQGIILLGKLQNIQYLTASYQQLSNNWRIAKQKNQINFPNSLIVNLGQDLSLPTTSKFDFCKDVQFMSYDKQGLILSNQKKNMQFLNNRLNCRFRSEGNYKIFLNNISQEISIQVIKGKAWQKTNRIFDEKNSILYNRNTNSDYLIGFNNQNVIQDKQDHYNIELNLSLPEDFNIDNIRTHIIASTFLYQNVVSQSIKKNMINQDDKKGQVIFSKQSSYLSNKILSDEHCYVISRQTQPKFIGNNLEKPRILLKKIYKRDTNVQNQVLNKGETYKNTLEKSKQRLTQLKRQRKSSTRQDLKIKQKSISTANNFLKYSSEIISNIHGKNIRFKIPKHYQIFNIIVTSQSFIIEREFTLPKVSLIKDDLRHSGQINSQNNSGLTMVRQVYKVYKGDNIKIKRDSEWMAIGARNIKNFAELRQNTLWQWALNWKTYTQEKKLEVYNEFCCHQLNTFIKFTDEEFFLKIVKPFILNKLQKTIVDHCLVQSKEVQKFITATQLSRLNPFQKCLVIDYLVKYSQIEHAKAISLLMESQGKTKKYNQQQYQSYFDTVLNSKLIERSSTPRNAIRSNKYKKFMDYEHDDCGGGGGGGDDYYMNRRAEKCQMQDDEDQDSINERKKFKPPAFKEIQSTKQYGQTTYFNQISKDGYYKIDQSKFWIDLSYYFLSDRKKQFITQNFIYLRSQTEFALALAFFPNLFEPNFNMCSQGQYIQIKAESTFLIFIKEFKEVPYQKNNNILINQRFQDTDENEDQIGKPVQQFIKDHIYSIQTVITNTSFISIDLQILLDIPKGSIALNSYESTQIINYRAQGYSTKQYRQYFYFPQAGEFEYYPANVGNNRKIISKAQKLQQKIIVKQKKENIKLQTFNDILASGTKQDILNYIKQKNIFDREVFRIDKIYWMFKNKEFYEQAIQIFESRKYYDSNAFQYGIYHNDSKRIHQILKYLFPDPEFNRLNLLQYYPLSSKRTHKFMNQAKSKILNVQFKQTYIQFLKYAALYINKNEPPTKFLLTFVYYLILQDRIQQATQVFGKIKCPSQNDSPRLQYDYLNCFLDIYNGYPNFTVARQISKKYINYPILTWRKLFQQVNGLLETHDSTFYEQQATKQYNIRIINKGTYLEVILPENSQIQFNFHAVNLELYFTESPFSQANIFSKIKPFKTQVVTSKANQIKKILKPEGYPNIFVEPIQICQDRSPQILKSFFWTHQELKVKIVQQEGFAIVYLDGKLKAGAYCKVYCKLNNNQVQFYKDGYTDIQGKFRYITESIDNIDKFALLFMTQKGGIIKTASKPNLSGRLGN